jgi:thiol-disulfide isomerase/thioredoxin
MDKLERLLAGGDSPSPIAVTRHAPAARGLSVGSPAPQFLLPRAEGGELTLSALLARGRPLLLVFLDPACGPCRALAPDVAAWQERYAGRLTVAVVSAGEALAEPGLADVLVQREREVADLFDVRSTPSAVLVHSSGIVAGALAEGAPAVRALVDRTVAVAGHERASALAVGDPAPPVRLVTLAGETFDLAASKRDTLLLFWNPACGFCQRMVDDLRMFLAAPPAGAPQLVLVATGSAEANAAMHLDSPVLLDPGFAVGRVFGAGGTPSAVLVDREGRIGSSVMVGADAVLGALGRRAAVAPQEV